MGTLFGFTLAILLSALYFATFTVTQAESAAVVDTSSGPNRIVYRRFVRRRPATNPEDQYVEDIMEIFHTKRRPPAMITYPISDDDVNNFIFCDFNPEMRKCQQNSNPSSHSKPMQPPDFGTRTTTTSMYPRRPQQTTMKRPSFTIAPTPTTTTAATTTTTAATTTAATTTTTTTAAPTTTTTRTTPPTAAITKESKFLEEEYTYDDLDDKEEYDNEDMADEEDDLDQITTTTSKIPFSFFD